MNKLAPEDFAPMAIELTATTLRKLIEGLRALPNVADLAVINAISEFDRLASILEDADRKKRKIFEAALGIARNRAPEIEKSMRETGTIPPEIMQTLVADLIGGSSCNCASCIAARERAMHDGANAPRH